jgi:hypothetical protein
MVLDALGALARVLFSIPYLGAVLGYVWGGLLTAIWMGAQFIDFFLTLLGIMPEKRMKVRVVIQLDEQGRNVIEEEIQTATAAAGAAYDGPRSVDDVLLPMLQAAIDVFKEQANVRILPVGYFKYASAFANVSSASDSSFLKVETKPSTPETLDVCCDSCAFWDNLKTVGPKFQYKMVQDCFEGNASSIIGYGAPVCAFDVRSFSDKKYGCSVPFTDYVTVDFFDAASADTCGANLTLAHELGHACNLTHGEHWIDHGAAGNLMNDDPAERGRSLTKLQVAILRMSRHVTYFDLPF